MVENGAPGGTRTPDLLVRRGISHYTPTHASLNQPIESTSEGNSLRLLLYPVVPRSRTITRTISAHQTPDPFVQLSILVKVLVATLMSMCVAKENLSLEMLTPTSVRPCPFARNASSVGQALVLGFLSTPLHAAVRCKSGSRARSDQNRGLTDISMMTKKMIKKMRAK